MQQHWFYDVWAFIGTGGAIVMVAIMLTTDTFRSNTTVSRWRDAVWLAWLAAPLYWVHQLKEYSLPVIGLPYSLPDMVCGQFDFPPYPACPIPMSFYPVVNISLMWFGAPLAAYICRRNVLIGLSSWGLIMANGFVHSAGGIAEGAYNTGLWTAAFLVYSVVTVGHLRLRDPRTVQRQSRGRGIRRRGGHSCRTFRRLRAIQGRGDRQSGPAGLCRRGRFHADHFGGPCEPVLQA